MATFNKYKKKGSNENFWEYRIYYHDSITGKTKEKSKKGFTSKPEAKLAAEEMERKLREGIEESPISLKEYLNIWLNEYQKDIIRDTTYDQREQNIRLHILPYFKNIRLNELKPIMYQKFLNHLADQAYSKRTIEINHWIMHSAYEKAIVLGKVSRNPCKGATIKGKVKDTGLKFIDSSDVARFLQEAYKYDYIYWIFFWALIDTGMRKGEAAALKWTDIDLKERTIDINKSLDFKRATTDKEKMFGDTKTYNSNRIIKISQMLANDLQFHLKYQNQNKLALKEAYHHELNLVFCRNDGNYLPKSSLFNAFSRILKKAELPQLPIHSLRHTHAVMQLEAGVDMKTLQERLGHRSYQVTADVYSHVSKKIETRDIEKYEAYTKNLFR